MERFGIRLTILYFFLVAALGTLLRSIPFFHLSSIDYNYVLHAHSHVAILGWGYLAMFLLFANQFFPNAFKTERHIRICFILTHLAIFGIFITFLLQGYGMFSNSFLALHGLLIYWFVFWFFRHSHRALKTSRNGTKNIPLVYANGALVALFISFFGPWSLGYLAASGLRDTPWFDLSVYFFLHFQYNGWFLFGLIAIVYAILVKLRIPFSRKLARLQFWFGFVSLFPAFLLYSLLLDPGHGWRAVAFLANCLQLVSVILFCVNMWRARSGLVEKWPRWSQVFLSLSVMALLLKTIMEILSAIPGLSELVFDTRSVVIGYLHLVLLGFMSFLVLALFLHKGWLEADGNVTRIAFTLFIIGFLLNELTLFLQGLMSWTSGLTLPYANALLFIAALMLLCGIGLFKRAR